MPPKTRKGKSREEPIESVEARLSRIEEKIETQNAEILRLLGKQRVNSKSSEAAAEGTQADGAEGAQGEEGDPSADRLFEEGPTPSASAVPAAEAEEVYEGEEQDLVPILAEGELYLDADDSVPEWFTRVFDADNEGFFSFPAGVRKSGHLPTSPQDVIWFQLYQQTQSASSENLKYAFKQYLAEWKILNQSIIYTNLIALALHQVNEALASVYPVPQIGNIPKRLKKAETILANLCYDQVRRATIVISAAERGLAVANKVSTGLQAKTLGVCKDSHKYLEETPSARTTSTYRKTATPTSASTLQNKKPFGKSKANVGATSSRQSESSGAAKTGSQ